MAGLIDYAGLFPPAKLELEPAIKNYASYLNGSEKWMLSNFIIPAQKLPKLTPEMMALFDDTGGLNFSVISQSFREDVQTIVEFRDKFPAQIRLNFIETKLHAADNISQAISSNNKCLQQKDLSLRVFYESSFKGDWQSNLQQATITISEANEEFGRNDGFKLRCGGVEPSMFPSIQQVATAMQVCRDTGLAMKFTAGLHHPIRHFDEAIKVDMHGFMNIFVAGMLGAEQDLEVHEIQGILAEENPENFMFTKSGLRWNDYEISSEKISTLRENKFISYGSCSVDEPREDLEAIGLLI